MMLYTSRTQVPKVQNGNELAVGLVFEFVVVLHSVDPLKTAKKISAKATKMITKATRKVISRRITFLTPCAKTENSREILFKKLNTKINKIPEQREAKLRNASLEPVLLFLLIAPVSITVAKHIMMTMQNCSRPFTGLKKYAFVCLALANETICSASRRKKYAPPHSIITGKTLKRGCVQEMLQHADPSVLSNKYELYLGTAIP
mmetsp:Transcript_7558/g.10975  ORF Transcript_7558/g.10975 Transcript_7558/m.10975 type:complete len:204 (-) Transcript_7558:1355-1966(-)